MTTASFARSLNPIPSHAGRGEVRQCGYPSTTKPLLLWRRAVSIRSVPGDIDLYNGRREECIRTRLRYSSSDSLIAASRAHASLALPPRRSNKKVCLFFCEEMRELAERVAMESDSIELRSINWRTFDDGFPNLFIPDANGIRGQHVSFLASFSSPRTIFEQVSIIYALPRLFVSSFTVVLPFFVTGSSERMEEEGDVATASTLARIFSNIPISRGGPSSLVIYDIHALQERFYFGDNVLPCFESGMPLLKNRLQQLPDSDNISIAFPDEGSWKRFHKQLQHYPVIVCTKVREGDQRFVRLKEGDPKGRHVVIVDDFVQSGGTLIECQKVLAAHGAAKISAYVTHGIFPNKTWQRLSMRMETVQTKGWSISGSPIRALLLLKTSKACDLSKFLALLVLLLMLFRYSHRRPSEHLSLNKLLITLILKRVSFFPFHFIYIKEIHVLINHINITFFIINKAVYTLFSVNCFFPEELNSICICSLFSILFVGELL